MEATTNERYMERNDAEKINDQETGTLQRAEGEPSESPAEATTNERDMKRNDAEKVADQATWRSCVPRLPLG